MIKVWRAELPLVLRLLSSLPRTSIAMCCSERLVFSACLLGVGTFEAALPWSLDFNFTSSRIEDHYTFWDFMFHISQPTWNIGFDFVIYMLNKFHDGNFYFITTQGFITQFTKPCNCTGQISPVYGTSYKRCPQHGTHQGCESSFFNGTKFSSSSEQSVELLELSSLSPVPLYKKFGKSGTKFSSSSKKWAELQELSSLN